MKAQILLLLIIFLLEVQSQDIKNNIVVIGHTGDGKSYFVNKYTGSNVPSSNAACPVTQKFQAVKKGNTQVYDTIGFAHRECLKKQDNSTITGDSKSLIDIIEAIQHANSKINFILYIEQYSTIRINSHLDRQLKMIKAFLKNVPIVYMITKSPNHLSENEILAFHSKKIQKLKEIFHKVEVITDRDEGSVPGKIDGFIEKNLPIQNLAIPENYIEIIESNDIKSIINYVKTTCTPIFNQIEELEKQSQSQLNIQCQMKEDKSTEICGSLDISDCKRTSTERITVGRFLFWTKKRTITNVYYDSDCTSSKRSNHSTCAENHRIKLKKELETCQSEKENKFRKHQTEIAEIKENSACKLYASGDWKTLIDIRF